MLVIIKIKAANDAAFLWLVILDNQSDNIKPNSLFNQSLGD
ncbi:hypothetical protein M917_2393 [Psychrobacter aquaticus CMS 56]|uniref:Uncharacterized protein n=1 Tax=Psychrobacter aquaticus CMS 56 TaxID=1354303 RepID=U4T2A3_9GAMM|nr:hypothetical protein M917_2393 [Psychrobacter aquaticus CMS 56]